MALRFFLRFTLIDDRNSAVRNQIAEELRSIGLQNTGTGLWEGDVSDEVRSAKVAGDVVAALARSRQQGILDHLWLYIDRRH